MIELNSDNCIYSYTNDILRTALIEFMVLLVTIYWIKK